MVFFQIVTALGIIIGGFWTLLRYVNERGSLTAVEFDVEYELIGETAKQKIVEFTVIVDNKGPLILIAEAILLRLRTIRETETNRELELFDRDKKDERTKQVRLKFPNIHTINPDTQNKVKLVPFKTFVKPGVRQKYPFVTAFKKEDEFVFAQADLKYGESGKNKKKSWKHKILAMCKKYGLRKHIITDIMERDQTAQRVFNLHSCEVLTNAPEEL